MQAQIFLVGSATCCGTCNLSAGAGDPTQIGTFFYYLMPAMGLMTFAELENPGKRSGVPSPSPPPAGPSLGAAAPVDEGKRCQKRKVSSPAPCTCIKEVVVCACCVCVCVFTRVCVKGGSRHVTAGDCVTVSPNTHSDDGLPVWAEGRVKHARVVARERSDGGHGREALQSRAGTAAGTPG